MISLIGIISLRRETLDRFVLVEVNIVTSVVIFGQFVNDCCQRRTGHSWLRVAGWGYCRIGGNHRDPHGGALITVAGY